MAENEENQNLEEKFNEELNEDLVDDESSTNQSFSQADIDKLLSGEIDDEPEEEEEEVDETPGSVTINSVQLDSLRQSMAQNPNGIKLDLLMNLSLDVSIELGRTEMLIKDILKLSVGSIIELNKLAGEPVDMLINNKKFAEGEVVVIDENFGLRITNLVNPMEVAEQFNEDIFKNLG